MTFIRSKFVTNSSSTSFIGYGVYFDFPSPEIESILENLLVSYPESASRYLEQFSGDTESTKEYMLEDPYDGAFEFLDHMFWELGLSPEWTPDEGVYIHIGLPLTAVDPSGNPMITQPNIFKRDYQKLRKLLDDAGLTNIQIDIVQDAWHD